MSLNVLEQDLFNGDITQDVHDPGTTTDRYSCLNTVQPINPLENIVLTPSGAQLCQSSSSGPTEDDSESQLDSWEAEQKEIERISTKYMCKGKEEEELRLKPIEQKEIKQYTEEGEKKDDCCIQCHSVVRPRQEALLCDGCQRWQHRKCNTGIPRHLYKQAVKDDSEIEWMCAECTKVNNEDHSFNIQKDSIPEGDTPVHYYTVEKGSIRGKHKLYDSNGYNYTVKKKKKDHILWRCAKRSKTVKCLASVIQDGDKYRSGLNKHIHLAKPRSTVAVQIKKKKKASVIRCSQQPSSDVQHQAVPNQQIPTKIQHSLTSRSLSAATHSTQQLSSNQTQSATTVQHEHQPQSTLEESDSFATTSQLSQPPKPFVNYHPVLSAFNQFSTTSQPKDAANSLASYNQSRSSQPDQQFTTNNPPVSTVNPFLTTTQPTQPSNQISSNHPSAFSTFQRPRFATATQSLVTTTNPCEPTGSIKQLNPSLNLFPAASNFRESSTQTSTIPIDTPEGSTPLHLRLIPDREIDGIFQRLSTIEKTLTEMKKHPNKLL